jgi:hypothetical protein
MREALFTWMNMPIPSQGQSLATFQRKIKRLSMITLWKSRRSVSLLTVVSFHVQTGHSIEPPSSEAVDFNPELCKVRVDDDDEPRFVNFICIWAPHAGHGAWSDLIPYQRS